MNLDRLIKINLEKPKKRVGRGIGSGKGGHTTGRGTKGQKARTGYNIPVGFEGGQTPLYKRMPKIGGFKNHRSSKVFAVAVDRLNSFENGEITPQNLYEKGIVGKIGKYTTVKIIGNQKVKVKLELKGFICSDSARKEIEKAGGSISSPSLRLGS